MWKKRKKHLSLLTVSYCERIHVINRSPLASCPELLYYMDLINPTQVVVPVSYNEHCGLLHVTPHHWSHALAMSNVTFPSLR